MYIATREHWKKSNLSRIRSRNNIKNIYAPLYVFHVNSTFRRRSRDIAFDAYWLPVARVSDASPKINMHRGLCPWQWRRGMLYSTRSVAILRATMNLKPSRFPTLRRKSSYCDYRKTWMGGRSWRRSVGPRRWKSALNYVLFPVFGDSFAYTLGLLSEYTIYVFQFYLRLKVPLCSPVLFGTALGKAWQSARISSITTTNFNESAGGISDAAPKKIFLIKDFECSRTLSTAMIQKFVNNFESRIPQVWLDALKAASTIIFKAEIFGIGEARHSPNNSTKVAPLEKSVIPRYS